jgi:hypothetical protein
LQNRRGRPFEKTARLARLPSYIASNPFVSFRPAAFRRFGPCGFVDPIIAYGKRNDKRRMAGGCGRGDGDNRRLRRNREQAAKLLKPVVNDA